LKTLSFSAPRNCVTLSHPNDDILCCFASILLALSRRAS
jgi:hypothetical protein